MSSAGALRVKTDLDIWILEIEKLSYSQINMVLHIQKFHVIYFLFCLFVSET